MSTATAPIRSAIDQAIFDRNAELFQGSVLAQMEDPERMEHVSEGATMVFLPRDDATGIESALAMAADLARRGGNDFLRHVDRDGRPI